MAILTPKSRSTQSSSSFSNSLGTSDSSSSSGDFYTPQQQGWISALYPQIANRFAAVNPQAAAQKPFASYLAEVGGPSASFPDITPTDIWSPQMTQERVNQMRAQNTAEAGGQVRNMRQQLSGAGFQSLSPLALELEGGIRGRDLASSTQGENDIRFKVAEGNAGNILRGQQLGLETASARADDDRRRRSMGLAARAQDLETGTSRENALLQALGYYNRPLQQARSTSKSRQEAKSGSASYSESRSGYGLNPISQELPW